MIKTRQRLITIVAVTLLSTSSALAAKIEKSANTAGVDAGAMKLMNQGNWNQAIERLKLLTDQSTAADRTEAWLAFAYLYQGKHAELKALDEAVTAQPVDPSDPLAKSIVHAFALTSQGKLNEASALLDSLGQQDQDVLFTFTRACVALKQGKPQDAAVLCERVVDLAPSFAWGYRTLGFIQEKSLKNPGSAERAYDRALAAEPGLKEVRDLLTDLRLTRNDFDGAIAVAKDGIKRFPKDPQQHYRLAQIYSQQFRYLESLEELDRAAILAKDDPRWYRSRASIFRQQGKLADAIEEQRKSVALGKDRAFELVELARLQEQHGDTKDAIASLRASIAENANQNAQQKLVALLQKEQSWAELIAELKKAVEANPKQANLRIGLAQAYKNNGKPDEAIAEFKEAANLEQNSPIAHREIGKIELSRNNYQAAAKSYTRALNINPSSVEDLVALGYCYANNNDFVQAETAFVTGLALLQLSQTTGGSSPVIQADIMRSLGSVLLTEGRYREAALNLEAVVGQGKDAARKSEDEFLMYQAQALRDRSAESVRKYSSAYASLPAALRKELMDDYVDTLLKLGKTTLVAEQLKEVSQDQLRKADPLLLTKLLLASGNPNEAAELAATSALETSRDNDTRAELFLTLAQAKIEQREAKAAEEAVNKALELNPKSFNAYAERSKLLLQEQKFENALAAAQRALEVNPYFATGYISAGDAYMRMNKATEAHNQYLKAAELYPNLALVHKKLRESYLKQSKISDAERESEIAANLEKNG
ncbi:MAG: tetratricopeptide repeat protein [Candidatus Obscuribacterales bacterium]|nr:tetratricopeptide repeat protein [Candidatus Obscuribacterales bacterium]